MKNSGSTVRYVLDFSEVTLKDIGKVGGKNASLGELINALQPKGINIPGGFATTADAWWDFISSNRLREPLQKILSSLDTTGFANIETVSDTARKIILTATLPHEVVVQVREAYAKMQEEFGQLTEVAVRSSATAEDLPGASFAGQHESYLNIRGEHDILNAILHCYASLYSPRAIKYREDKKFGHSNLAISTGIQRMVRSDLACSGVCFTLEPESGFRDVVHISGSWGLGENVVQGKVNPDEFLIFKKTFVQGRNAIISRKLGDKDLTMIYSGQSDHRPGTSTVNVTTPPEKRKEWILTDAEINQLVQWALMIEQHYGQPMDIEWAKDGISKKFFIVQARPETAHGSKTPFIHSEYTLKEKGERLTSGIAVGSKIASGRARKLSSPSEAGKLQPGEILITEITNPDWDTVMKKAGAIVTDKGGRTSHASIVARELGIVAVVGCNDATQKIADGEEITVSCAEGQTGFIYRGKLKFDSKEFDLRSITLPKTEPMIILGDPAKAFALSFYPNSGVGLMRLEFVITSSIRVHPMALVRFDTLKDANAKKEIEILTSGYPDKKKFFIHKLSEAVAVTAAAFYPKDVIVRMSDFKTNEYAGLIGGKEFEPREENPMIGFRGASRYYNDRYKEGFRLECEAMKRVRDEMGFTNVKLMIPFCRTVEEAKRVVETMESFGLVRGKNALELYMMVEIPSNVLLAEKFSEYFDGFSIGSNDLTQLTLGIDRDSSVIQSLFDERNEASMQLIALAIKKAHEVNRKIGLCGQAASDFPEFASFLVEQGIHSISFNPDALMQGIKNIQEAEQKKELVMH